MNNVQLGVILTVFLILCVAFVGAFMLMEQSPHEDWYQVEHDCPECSWSGYAGEMVVVEADGWNYYYCPECGAFLARR